MYHYIIVPLLFVLLVSGCAVRNPISGETRYEGTTETEVSMVVASYDRNWQYAFNNRTIAVTPRQLGRGGSTGSPHPDLACFYHRPTEGVAVKLCLPEWRWLLPPGDKPGYYHFTLASSRSRTAVLPLYTEFYPRGYEPSAGYHAFGVNCRLTDRGWRCNKFDITVEPHGRHHDYRPYGRPYQDYPDYGDFRRERFPPGYCGGYLGERRQHCPPRW